MLLSISAVVKALFRSFVDVNILTMALPGFIALPSDPLLQVGLVGILVVLFLSIVFAAALIDQEKRAGPLASVSAYARFVYTCFLKPHNGDLTGSQQDALESFYKAQAKAYDRTRSRLLHGREDMLSMAASQLKQRGEIGGQKPIWVDVRAGRIKVYCDSHCTDYR